MPKNRRLMFRGVSTRLGGWALTAKSATVETAQEGENKPPRSLIPIGRNSEDAPPRTEPRPSAPPAFPREQHHHPEINDQPVYSSRAWKGRAPKEQGREAWGSPVRDLSQTFFLAGF